MYKAVIFDLYGTLLDIHTDEDQNQLWEKMAFLYSSVGACYRADALKEAYLSHVENLLEKRRKKGADFPDIDLIKVFKYLYTSKNVKVSKETLKETAKFFRILSLDYVRPYQGAIELLDFLRQAGYKVLLLSNAQESFTMSELEVTGIRKCFDGIYLSSQYKVAKPSKAFFEVLLEREKLSPSECLFIGNDHTTDIEGANQMGMDSVYLHTNCSLSEVPEVLDVKLRIDSGDLYELIEWMKTLHFES